MNDPTAQNEDRRQFQMSFLKEVVCLNVDERVLDYGCGAIRAGRALIAYLEADRYFGVDLRSTAIDEAHAVAAVLGLEDKRPTLITFDPDTDPSIDTLGVETFDLIWAFSVLIHMTDERLDAFLYCTRKRLAPQGRAYANVNVGERATNGEWNAFPVVWRPLGEFNARAHDAGLRCKALGPLRRFGSHLNRSADKQEMLIFNH